MFLQDSNTLWHWKKWYEAHGENGLIPRRGSGRDKIPIGSVPNKMWQSDIMRFQIKSGVYGYLIEFIDDHSRYITGLGVYLDQTAENVLEVYRRAVGEYGKPEELLTDNGRQYTNWRGKTAFEKELGRDRVHYFRSDNLREYNAEKDRMCMDN